MKSLKNVMLFGFCVLVISMLGLSLQTDVKGEMSGHYIYKLLNENSVEITGYLGEDHNVIIPDKLDGKTVAKIGNSAFFKCYNLIEVTIPNGVTSIGNAAFAECLGLIKVKIPNSVTNIGEEAFAQCLELREVTIPDSVTNIGEFVFMYCVSLKKATISKNVENISREAFRGCKELKNITIQRGLKTISYGAFCGCERLKEITIPDSVTNIDKAAFFNCYRLKNVTLPRRLQNNDIMEKAFLCTKFGVYQQSRILNLKVKTISGGFIKIIGLINKNVNTVNIPTEISKLKVIEISDHAFENSDLTSVKIPESVTIIGKRAFANCMQLEEVIMNDIEKINIAEDAFLNTPWGNREYQLLDNVSSTEDDQSPMKVEENIRPEANRQDQRQMYDTPYPPPPANIDRYPELSYDRPPPADNPGGHPGLRRDRPYPPPPADHPGGYPGLRRPLMPPPIDDERHLRGYYIPYTRPGYTRPYPGTNYGRPYPPPADW